MLLSFHRNERQFIRSHRASPALDRHQHLPAPPFILIMETKSLALADILRALREDIQAENTLIASRVTWYVTSQSFLLTAYAASWSTGFLWQSFFHHVMPIAAIVLSVVILASIYAATWAQDVYLREQEALVSRINSEFQLSDAEKMALQVYERTMVVNRANGAGKIVGGRIHALVRITPLVLPVGFSALWLYALIFAPAASS